MFTAGQGIVRLALNSEALSAGFRNVSQMTSQFAQKMAGITAKLTIVTGAVAGLHGVLDQGAHVFAEYGDQLGKMSRRTGVSVEALSRLAFAASRSGSSIEEAEAGIKKMQEELGKAERGDQGAILKFQNLGLTLKDLKDQSPEEAFKRIGEAMSKIPDATQRASAATELLGDAGVKLIPLFEQGREGLESLEKEADRLGQTFDNQTAEKAEALADTFGDLMSVTKGIFFAIGGALAPIITETGNRIASLVVLVKDWIDNNQELVGMVFKVVTAVGLVVSGMTALAGAITVGAAGFSVFAGIVGALLSPIGAFIAIIGAAGYALYQFLIPGDTFLEKLGSIQKFFLDLWATIKPYWTAFVEAVVIGLKTIMVIGEEWKLALQIVWKSFILGILSARDSALTFFNQLGILLDWLGRNWKDVFIDLANVLSYTVENMAKNVKNFFVALWNYMKGADWEFAWTPMLEGFNSVLQEMPDLAKGVVVGEDTIGTAAELAELGGRMGKKIAMGLEKDLWPTVEENINKAADAAGNAAGAGAGAGGDYTPPSQGKGSSFVDIKSAFDAITQKAAEDKTAKETLAVNQRQLKALEKNNELQEKSMKRTEYRPEGFPLES